MHAELAFVLVTSRIAEAHRESAAERLAIYARRASRSTSLVSRLAIRRSQSEMPGTAAARAI